MACRLTAQEAKTGPHVTLPLPNPSWALVPRDAYQKCWGPFWRGRQSLDPRDTDLPARPWPRQGHVMEAAMGSGPVLGQGSNSFAHPDTWAFETERRWQLKHSERRGLINGPIHPQQSPLSVPAQQWTLFPRASQKKSPRHGQEPEFKCTEVTIETYGLKLRWNIWTGTISKNHI